MRVEIPTYNDRWMMGDRFGEVLHTEVVTIAYIKLDKSGKTVRVNLADCKQV